jgi:hypothetical protein
MGFFCAFSRVYSSFSDYKVLYVNCANSVETISTAGICPDLSCCEVKSRLDII